jgi:hypothetical protein
LSIANPGRIMRNMTRKLSIRRLRRGQTLTEYAVAMGVLMGVIAMAALFLYTFKEYGGRILDLVASEYP